MDGLAFRSLIGIYRTNEIFGRSLESLIFETGRLQHLRAVSEFSIPQRDYSLSVSSIDTKGKYTSQYSQKCKS